MLSFNSSVKINVLLLTDFTVFFVYLPEISVVGCFPYSSYRYNVFVE